MYMFNMNRRTNRLRIGRFYGLIPNRLVGMGLKGIKIRVDSHLVQSEVTQGSVGEGHAPVRESLYTLCVTRDGLCVITLK